MAKKATTLHDNLGNDLLPVTNASITFMDDGNSVQSEIQDLKEKTKYNKGHYTTEQDLLTAYPNNIENPQSRKGWYAIIGETDSVWIWDIEGNEWKDSGVSSGGVESVNGLDGEVVLTGGNINATATINDTSKTELINAHLTDIYSELDNKVDLDSSQIITGTKVFTETIGLANTSEGTVDQIKHINSNFLITSGTGQNLLNIDEGLEKISAFNRELAYEDEIAEIQGNYATKNELSQEIQTVTDMIPTDNLELTNGANYATEQYVQQNGGKIDTISVNGVQQDITNKNVNISVPTDYVTNQQLTDGLNSKQNNLTSSQLQAVNSGATSTNIGQIITNSNNINTINSKIPNQASSTNQLADRDFVNSSLNSITAFYITSNVDGDPFSTKSALTSATTYYSGGQVVSPTKNDYAIVLQDETKDNATTRYIYYNQWEYQYTVNETALTADQLSAINSGITSTLVGKISSNETMLNSLAEQVATDYAQKSELNSYLPLSGGTMTGALNFSSSGNIQSDAKIFRFGNSSDAGSVAVLAGTDSSNFFRPSLDNKSDLGRDYIRWKNLYLSGVLSDGTNNISVANIANKSEMPTNYLTTDTKQNVTASKIFTKGIGVGLQSDDYWTITGDTGQLLIGKGSFDSSSNHTGNSPYLALKSNGNLLVANQSGTQRTVAYTTDIPDTSGFVTTNTEQTISGDKTFSSTVKSTGGFSRDGTAVFDASGTNEFYLLTSAGGAAYINFAGSGISGKSCGGTYYFGNGTGTPGQTSGKIYCGDVYVDNGSTQVARKTDLGTQATYSLSGTTLTITPK